MADGQADHWRQVYTTKQADAVSWFEADAASSLAALDRFGATPDMSLIDIGGGASQLVDGLLARGWSDLAVLDIADSALAASRARLGTSADAVEWLVTDITLWRPERAYQVWHDRAVFHFLTDPAERASYRQALAAGLVTGGLLLVATFAPDGPEQCSGLPVCRYDAAALTAEFGAGFALLGNWRAEHLTPWGAVQAFTWCALRKLA